MKKIITLSVLTVIIIGLAIIGLIPVRAEDNLTVTTTNSLEKIPSPDQIKYFKVIKKENGSLYGIRLSKDEKNQTTERNNANQTKTINTKAQLEKILAPQFISLYENIQKIGNSLWGIKKKTSSTDTNISVNNQQVKPVLKQRLVTAEMIVCISAAIDKKDEALQKVIDFSSDSLKAAISVRNECQKKAIQTTENQLENLNICIKDFQAKHQEIIKQARNDQQIIWKNYQSDLKACVKNNITVDNTSESSELIIEDGSKQVIEDMLVQ